MRSGRLLRSSEGEEDRDEEVRFTEQQIAHALRQAEQGTPAVEVCRKLGVSEATFCTWKKRYASMRKLPRQVDTAKLDSTGASDLGRNVSGGTWPRLSWGRSVL